MITNQQKRKNERIVCAQCKCGEPYLETRPMLRCDNCRDWYHGECVDYLCKSCQTEKAPTEETKEVDYHINRIEEMKKEQEKLGREILHLPMKSLLRRISPQLMKEEAARELQLALYIWVGGECHRVR